MTDDMTSLFLEGLAENDTGKLLFTQDFFG